MKPKLGTLVRKLFPPIIFLVGSTLAFNYVEASEVIKTSETPTSSVLFPATPSEARLAQPLARRELGDPLNSSKIESSGNVPPRTVTFEKEKSSISPLKQGSESPSFTNPTSIQKEAKRFISGEHVNLIRVAGEAITDVVYDAEALEVEADKAHGVVFLRTKASWLTTGKTRTAAFFNTASHSYGLLLEVASIGPQTIEIAGLPLPKTQDDAVIAPPASAMARFEADSYVGTLKALLVRALRGEVSQEPAVGMAFSPKDKSFVSLNIERREWACNGFHIEETHAYVTQDYLVEVLTLRNLMMHKLRVPLGSFAETRRGVLALATEKTTLAPAEVTDVVLISSRALRESGKGMNLVSDGGCMKRKDLGVEK